MKRVFGMILIVGLLLSGCGGWLDGQYVSVEPYADEGYRAESEITSVSTYTQMRSELADMVENGVQQRTLSLENMSPEMVENNMRMAVHYATMLNPIGAFAVEDIAYELGTTSGVPAVMITITYNRSRGEIQRIRQVSGMTAAKELITGALNAVEAGIVLKISDYREIDYTQLVQDYAMSRPDSVMEIPQVTVATYPQSGLVRVVELKFDYQTSRESLKEMQRYVQPVFYSAALFVSGEEETPVKFARLYAFLMETTDYTQETSITPSYSLLRHGVGDSKALAVVYAAMCARANLDCRVVSGTREGEPWFWNIINEDGVYYHVDLLRASAMSSYQKFSDEDMEGYVWDYAAYPQCGMSEEETDGTE